MVSRQFIIKGRVQGVGYRQSVVSFIRSQSLTITGFVRNLNNGDVEVVVNGNESEIEELYQFCLKGPTLSRVDSININILEHLGAIKKFEIRY